MNKKLLISFLSLPLILSACGGGNTPSSQDASSEPGTSSEPGVSSSSQQGTTSSSSEEASSSEESSSAPKQEGHTEEEVQEYMDALKKSSQANHVYYHYYRYGKDYDAYDVWAWPYRPKEGEGYRWDWVGRTSFDDRSGASGTATIDSFGYACVDIDLTVDEYNGGWKNSTKTIGGIPTNFYTNSTKTEFDTKIGLQIVESETRYTGSGFWVNDGSNLFVTLDDYAIDNTSGGKSYHIFVTQDNVQNPSAIPPIDNIDPFEGDDGSNVTYGKAQYADVNFSKVAAKQKTSKLFLQGDSSKSWLTNGAGVGYQIMVSSFADSDGDGSGDILGITEKIGYLKDLGVNVLWLTPIQMSDSYHGYDISDYTQVDPKFGSKASKHTVDGVPTADSAMEDYKDLIAEAHKNKMAVVMDLVLNHTATTNKWFIKSAQLNEKYRGYYQWGNHEKKDADHPYGQSDKINQEKFWYPYGNHSYSYYAKFGSSMPELNYAYVSTRAAVATMAKQWCEIGVDGFRMDAVKHIFLEEEVKTDSGDKIIKDISVNPAGYEQDYSSNLTKNLHFWRQLAADVKAYYPNCFFVGENFDGHAYNVAPYYEGFDSLFDFYTYFNLTTLAAKSWGTNKSSIYGGPTSANGFLGSPTSDPGSDKEGNVWDLWHVLKKYDEYRGDKAIMGSFTSNHDIARTINRIAGYGAPGSEGIASQGNVSTSTFGKLDKLATLVQLTELMLPGCTWIYYGDEIGMTGNFPNEKYDLVKKDGTVVTKDFDKDAPYADLWYRQPMKWTANGKVGDGSYTTGYDITGSGSTVRWDVINGSSTMKSVAEQLTTNGSHLKAIQAFAKVKSTTPALIRGSMEDKGWGENNYMVNMWRTLGSDTYAFVANYATSGTVSMGYGNDGWKPVASFNGATGTSMPAMSAILLKK